MIRKLTDLWAKSDEESCTKKKGSARRKSEKVEVICVVTNSNGAPIVRLLSEFDSLAYHC